MSPEELYNELDKRLSSIEVKISDIESIKGSNTEIKMYQRDNLLRMFYNRYFKEYVALEIDFKVLEGRKDEEIFQEVPIQGIPNPQGSITMRKITVKQQKELYQKRLNNISKVIEVIKSLLNEE